MLSLAASEDTACSSVDTSNALDPDCVPVLRFLGRNLERVNKSRSQELELQSWSSIGIHRRGPDKVRTQSATEGRTIPGNRKSHPANQESFATLPGFLIKGHLLLREQTAYWEALHELFFEDMVDSNDTKFTPVMHYNSESQSNAINLLAIVRCLNWSALRTRPDIAWATSRAASMITHDPGTSFTRVKYSCQYLHHTLGFDLGYVPLTPDAKQKLWLMGDAFFAPTGRRASKA